MDSFNKLEEMFRHFPGIGPRQAKRFVYHILTRSPSYIEELSNALKEVKKASHECLMCHRLYIEKSTSPKTICSICSNSNRNKECLMIVCRDSDLENIERSSVYDGLYFVLGGSVPILDKEPQKRIRLSALSDYLKDNPSVKEIILSVSVTPEGEYTSEIVSSTIKNTYPNIKISHLGRGISTGAELEYIDADTIKNALINRA